MILHAIAFIVGFFMVGAAAHVNISNSGGYFAGGNLQPHAVLIFAIAAGVAVAAIAIGRALDYGNRKNAAWLIMGIICGEGFGFAMTAERLVAGREAAQAPLRAAQIDIDKARRRVATLESSIKNAPTSSPRLTRAEEEKARADAAATAQSSLQGCRENCRQLLQAQVDLAYAEVSQARNELANHKIGIEGDLREARLVLGRMAPPPSATPLADRLGIPAWVVDLAFSALGSLAANGLGCGLIAFGTIKAGRDDDEVFPPSSVGVLTDVTQAALPPPRKRGSIKAFMVDCAHKVPGQETEAGNAHSAYVPWCEKRGEEPEDQNSFTRQFERLCREVGIRVIDDPDGKTYALDMSVIPT